MVKDIQKIIQENEQIKNHPYKSQLLRFHMYKAIEKTVQKFNPKGIGLTIADLRPIIFSMMKEVTFYNLHYPEYDIQNLDKIPDNSVDVFYSDMVLEHIEDPQKAVDETYRILKPGGIAIHTTVFIMPYHPSPIDLRRFSPDLLKRMHSKYSNVVPGGNGNWRSLMAMASRMTRFPVKYPNGNLLSTLLKGENPKYMITTWVVAQK